jgi:flagellar basal-body rod modification protein FlgD
MINALSSTTSAGTSVRSGVAAQDDGQDRFLRLLVTQMQNQDPLNPMDNAQVTSQMAQIQTVSGLEKLNGTVAGLHAQFGQLQALQGAALVGRDVVVPGDRLQPVDGAQRGGFALAAPADEVRIEVLDGAGRVVDTLTLDARDAGRHDFEWTPPRGVDASQGQRFRVAASLGGVNVASEALTRDRVVSVSHGQNGLQLELARAGIVGYDDVLAVN